MAAITSVRCGACFFPRKQFGCTSKRCRGPKPTSPARMKMRQQIIQRQKELEDRIRETLKADVGKPLDVTQWQELERGSRSGDRPGRIIRLQALEWLRLESLYRGFSPRELAVYEMDPQLSPPEYQTIKERGHDQLLSSHPVPFWPYSLTEFAAGLADDVKALSPGRLVVEGKRTDSTSIRGTASLPEGDWIYFSPARILLSFDPWQPTRRLLKAIQREARLQIKHAREQKGKARLPGAGRPIALPRLRLALWAHDQSQWGDAKQIAIGTGAFELLGRSKSYKQRENLGAELLALANRMIRVARQSETWFATFR
jgi:hypothetical protein